MSVAQQFSCKGSHTVNTLSSREIAVLNTETLHDTDDIIEETHGFARIVGHLHVFDDMTTTVIVTLETVCTRSDGNHQRVFQVDVGSLQNIEIASLHQTDGQNDILQVLGSGYSIWVFLGTISQSGNVQRVVRIDTIAIVYHGMVA